MHAYLFWHFKFQIFITLPFIIVLCVQGIKWLGKGRLSLSLCFHIIYQLFFDVMVYCSLENRLGRLGFRCPQKCRAPTRIQYANMGDILFYPPLENVGTTPTFQTSIYVVILVWPCQAIGLLCIFASAHRPSPYDGIGRVIAPRYSLNCISHNPYFGHVNFKNSWNRDLLWTCRFVYLYYLA